MAGKRRNRPTWVRFSGIGFEFAAAVCGFTLIGYWIDRHYDSGPTGVLVGAALGIVGGGYNLIRESFNATKEASADDQRKDDSGDGE